MQNGITPLEQYAFMMTWKAVFDFRILEVFKVPLKSLVAQRGQPHHIVAFFQLRLRSTSQGASGTA